MSQRTSLVFGALSLLAAAGCAGKNSSFQPVDGATAGAAGSDLGDSSESSAGGFGGASGPGFAAHHFAPGPGGGCDTGSVSATPASPVDTDQDNTPDTVVFTFTNCAFVGSNGTETFNGTVSITDGTPTVADFDFNAAHDVTIAAVGAGNHAGENATIHVNGARSASGTAGGTTFNLADSTSNDADYSNGSESHHVSDAKTWNLSYTPATTWAPGS